ncbi:type II TA system antitoxin MqsA family protein [Bacillus cereus]|uniref:type II TA system antitoxin MqsA family protein n=1 Tax=Bacillus cereus TaxID=1396 RepID=UPI000BFB60D4|nr:type II TA system antitoxin MqsA family protein [Bacillus cereus]PGW26856.1 hypothetical protein COD88_15290 [Bacillus cereus]
MKLFCFECCEETNVYLDTKLCTATYQNKEFTYTAEIYRCKNCKNEIHSDQLFNKNLKNSIEIFQKLNKMLTANDFKYIRENIYNLSVRTLAAIIGCSPATISKYENGALQSKQHDLQFKLLISPKNMVNLVEASNDELKPNELQKINERLQFLLEAVKVEELLKGLESEIDLPDFEIEDSKIETLSLEKLEGFFILKGHVMTENEGYDYRVSNLKLQKLMYYAVGWYSAITKSELIDADFEAWKHGPVIKDTYHKYKGLGADSIPLELEYDSLESLNLHPIQLKVLEWAWEKYSHFDGKYLENMTHEEEPWKNARIGLSPEMGSNRIIGKSDIHSYFGKVYEALRVLNRKV